MATNITVSGVPHLPILPTEIIDHIIRCLIPSDDPSPIAFPQSHPVTKTLLSLMLTSRSTYIEAIRLLYNHCLYIDSAERLHRLSLTVSIATGRQPSHLVDVPLIPRFMHPIHRPNPKLLRISSIEELTPAESILAESHLGRLPTLPHFLPHECITSLYLRPCSPDQKTFATVIDLAIAHSLHDLISIVAPTLKRLVVDIKTEEAPYPGDDPFCIIIAIRDVFEQCVKTKYLCSMQDSFVLQTWMGAPTGFIHYRSRDPPVWHAWVKLKTLILHRVPMNENEFWGALRRIKNLKVVGMVRPIGLEHIDIRAWWLDGASGEYWKLQESKGDYGDMKVIIVDAEREPIMVPLEPQGWVGDARSISIRRVWVPVDAEKVVDRMGLCQEWSLERALRCSLPEDW